MANSFHPLLRSANAVRFALCIAATCCADFRNGYRSWSVSVFERLSTLTSLLADRQLPSVICLDMVTCHGLPRSAPASETRHISRHAAFHQPTECKFATLRIQPFNLGGKFSPSKAPRPPPTRFLIRSVRSMARWYAGSRVEAYTRPKHCRHRK